jgi:hypothetical protein
MRRKVDCATLKSLGISGRCADRMVLFGAYQCAH